MPDNTYELTAFQDETTDAQLHTLVDNAFSKSLGSVIMAQFPIASIIAIFSGKKASKMVAQIDELAAQTGKNPGGKRMAAKIMSLVGLISGIYYTAFYATFGTLYLSYFFFAFIMLITQL